MFCALQTYAQRFVPGSGRCVALLRDCHPACGLLVYVATQSNPSARSGRLGGLAWVGTHCAQFCVAYKMVHRVVHSVVYSVVYSERLRRCVYGVVLRHCFTVLLCCVVLWRASSNFLPKLPVAPVNIAQAATNYVATTNPAHHP